MKDLKQCEIEGCTNKVKKKHRRFCGRKCAAIHRKTVWTPQMISEMQKQKHKENPQRAKDSSKRMKLNNPTKNPEVIKKIKEHWKTHEHPIRRQRLKGGNGKELPFAQRVLWAALGSKWETEHPISLGKKQEGYPTNYKVDIGNRELKVWIEIDGWSHDLKDKKALDIKKENKLRELGWRGLRFRNQEILNNLREVLYTISKFLNTHHTLQKTY